MLFMFMKKYLFSILLAILPYVIFANYSTSMFPIINKSEEIVRLIEDDWGMEVVRMEYDILRTTKTTMRTLTNEYTYVVVAFGDFRFRDIDVKVYKNVYGEWQLVEKDADSSAIAAVSLTPTQTCEYLIEISAFSFESGYEVGHYGLIIAHE